jgi:histidinol phosphatase-like enzyme
MAKNDWSIQMKKSVMIGDAVSDKYAAKNSGVKFYYKKKGSLYSQVKNILGKI